MVSSLPLLVAHAITAVLGLTRNALLTNCLTKDDFGVLNYVMSWLAVVAVLGMPGLNLAVAQYVARGHWEAVRLGLRRRLVLSVLPMVTLAAIGWIGSKAGRTDIAPSVCLSGTGGGSLESSAKNSPERSRGNRDCARRCDTSVVSLRRPLDGTCRRPGADGRKSTGGAIGAGDVRL